MKKDIEAFKRLEATAPTFGGGSRNNNNNPKPVSSGDDRFPRHYSVQEVASRSGFSKRHILRLVEEGVFEKVRDMGSPSKGKRQIRIPEPSVEKWLEDTESL